MVRRLIGVLDINDATHEVRITLKYGSDKVAIYLSATGKEGKLFLPDFVSDLGLMLFDDGTSCKVCEWVLRVDWSEVTFAFDECCAFPCVEVGASQACCN